MKNLFSQLTEIPSVSGSEQKIGAFISSVIRDYVDEVYTDALDNVIAVKKSGKPDAKKIMMAAHMDEIGFMVTYIEDDGFIRIAPIGGINWCAVAYGVVAFDNGLRGVIVPEGNVSPNEFNNIKMYVDIGAKNKEDAEKAVQIGMTLTLASNYTELTNNTFAASKLDDKIACLILIRTIMELKDVTPPEDLYFVFTVQEEVGLRGARTSSQRIQPDYSIAVDVTGTGDTLKANPMAVKIGGGAAIKIKDNSVICHRSMINLLEQTAKKHNIPHQFEILQYGGTDTANMQAAGTGSIAGAISIPSRYIHSGVETCSWDDVEACIALLSKALSDFKI